MAKLEKVVINGNEVVGDVEFIRTLLGIGAVSRTESVKTENTPKVKESKKSKTNKVDEYFDNANLVQVQDKVIDLGTPSVPNGYIATGYKVEYEDGVKIYRVSHSICGSAKYRDSKTGEMKTRKFNKYPKSLANAEIRKLATLPEFKGQLFEFRKPFNDGSNKTFPAWGFKSEDLANKALEVLPKFVLKEEPNKK